MRLKDLGNRPAPASIRNLIARALRGHAPTVQVERRELPYWQERGWTKKGNTYTGSYQTRYGAFWGEIHEHHGTDIEFFLFQPSEQIQRHHHWICFQHRGDYWFLVHMGKRPKDVSSGIITIERLITESYES